MEGLQTAKWEHPLGNPLPERVAVVRALKGLGDLLCAVPAWRALRVALPRAHVTLVGLPWARSFVERFSRYLDDLVEFPGYPGIPEVRTSVRDLPEFLTRVHGLHFDLAIQMQGSGIVSNPITVLLGARLNAGFYLPSQYCPDPERFLALPAHEPEVRRHLLLMEHLGIPSQGEDLEFPLYESDALELGELDATRDLRPGEYVCIHPGAQEVQRRWPPEKFAAVGDSLAQQGLQVVLTGTTSEAGVTRAVVQIMRAPAIDLAGRTSLGALATLLRDARLLVCNDTGVSHLAAALRVPSVVIFISSDATRWAPLDRRLHRVVGWPGLPNACIHTPTVDGHRCLRDGCWQVRVPAEDRYPATAEAVLAEAWGLLAATEEGVYASH